MVLVTVKTRSKCDFCTLLHFFRSVWMDFWRRNDSGAFQIWLMRCLPATCDAFWVSFAQMWRFVHVFILCCPLSQGCSGGGGELRLTRGCRKGGTHAQQHSSPLMGIRIPLALCCAIHTRCAPSDLTTLGWVASATGVDPIATLCCQCVPAPSRTKRGCGVHSGVFCAPRTQCRNGIRRG